MKNRKIFNSLKFELSKPEKRIIFLWGVRQIGKSTILNSLYKHYGGVYLNFEDENDRIMFIPNSQRLKELISFKTTNPNSHYIFIDEVQKNPESTRAMKLLIDTTDTVIFATGSSELRAKANEFDSLAGRYKEYILFPLTIDEVALFRGDVKAFFDKPNTVQSHFLEQYIDPLLIYGGYPSVVLAKAPIEELRVITESAVIKDIVSIYDLKNTTLVYNLLRLLAFQVGNLVNISELSSSLGISRITVDNYLSILIKNRIIYMLSPYTKGGRSSVLLRKKVYFYDLGIRNSILNDFRPMTLRPDAGNLFENLVVMGFLRRNTYDRNNNSLFYYRDYSRKEKEIDIIMKKPTGEIYGYEIKTGHRRRGFFPQVHLDSTHLVTRDTSPQFLV